MCSYTQSSQVTALVHVKHENNRKSSITDNVGWKLNPFRTAVSFWGQTRQNSSSLSTKRDCSPKGVKRAVILLCFCQLP